MIAALLAGLLLLAPEETAQGSLRALVQLTESEPQEPEPPPGVRAPPETERYRKAARRYGEAMARFEKLHAAWRRTVVDACAAYLERYPDGDGVLFVRATRADVNMRSARFAEARRDLEILIAAPEVTEEAQAVARRELVAACRGMGDYRAALKYGGPTPDRLEEAGEIERAIEAARAAGDSAKADRWGLIGRPFSGTLKIPSGFEAVVVEAGKRLSPERKAALKKRFSSKKVGFLSTTSLYPAVYLLDEGKVVRAVDPLPDTWEHRLHSLTAD